MNQTSHTKIDCVVRVVTPENVEFEYLIAGPFQRILPFLVDLGLRLAILVVIGAVGLFIGVPLAGGTGAVVSGFLGLLAFFALSWLYGTVMEAQFNGRTVGKMMFGLRVISVDGRPINTSQAALRNLLRLSDFMPPLSLTLFNPDAPPANAIPTFFVALLTMTLTTRMQRLGDVAAGTMVVWDGRRGFHVNLTPEDARAYALAELIPPTFQISRTLARAVALYMERRAKFSPMRRREIANNLAEPLIALFELQPDTSSDLLLCALYVRIYHSEEQRAERLAAARKLPPSQVPSSFPAAPPQSKMPPTDSAVAAIPQPAVGMQVISADIIEATAIDPQHVDLQKIDLSKLDAQGSRAGAPLSNGSAVINPIDAAAKWHDDANWHDEQEAQR